MDGDGNNNDGTGLSEYERMRLKKIARNNAYLTSIGLAWLSPSYRVGIIGGFIQRGNKNSGGKQRRRIKKAASTTAGADAAATAPRRFSNRLKIASETKKASPTTVPGVSPRRHDPPIDPAIANAKRWMAEHGFGDADRTDRIDDRDDGSRFRTPGRSRKKQRAAAAPPEGVGGPRDYERDAFLALREWRRARDAELGYGDPCVVCHNRTLVEMCRLVPKNEEELLGVWGIGPKRFGQHGSLMLEALGPWRRALEDGHAKHGNSGDDTGGNGGGCGTTIYQ